MFIFVSDNLCRAILKLSAGKRPCFGVFLAAPQLREAIDYRTFKGRNGFTYIKAIFGRGAQNEFKIKGKTGPESLMNTCVGNGIEYSDELDLHFSSRQGKYANVIQFKQGS